MANEKFDKKGSGRRGKKKPFEKRFPDKKGNYKNDSLRGPDTRVCAGSKDNDPSWYALNPQLLKDAASFPYAWPLGNRLNLGKFARLINKGSVPGIMAMNWVPTIGYSSNGTSPANVASINTYTKVRHDNSGHALRSRRLHDVSARYGQRVRIPFLDAQTVRSYAYLLQY